MCSDSWHGIYGSTCELRLTYYLRDTISYQLKYKTTTVKCDHTHPSYTGYFVLVSGLWLTRTGGISLRYTHAYSTCTPAASQTPNPQFSAVSEYKGRDFGLSAIITAISFIALPESCGREGERRGYGMHSDDKWDHRLCDQKCFDG